VRIPPSCIRNGARGTHDMFTMLPGLGRLTDHYRLTTKGPRAAV
jgi:hypothetical protein